MPASHVESDVQCAKCDSEAEQWWRGVPLCDRHYRNQISEELTTIAVQLEAVEWSVVPGMSRRDVSSFVEELLSAREALDAAAETGTEDGPGVESTDVGTSQNRCER